MDEQKLIYPVARLLANPRLFHAISEYLGGPDSDTVREAFYDLLEYSITNADSPEECIFEAEEVCFQASNDGINFDIIFDTGYASNLCAVEGELHASITSDSDMAASFAIYQRLVRSIEESHPELEGNIVLCSPPTPGNSYLRSNDGNRFEGSFHLLSDPEKLYSFNVEVIDVATDQLKATICPE